MKTLRIFAISLVALTFLGCNDLWFNWDPDAKNQNRGPWPANPELPEVNPEDINARNYIRVTHEAMMDLRKVRNYSLCFDKTKAASCWVAYPMHRSYTGSTKRYDQRHKGSWPYDPLIADSFQKSGGTYGGGYTRGHQIPSADRTCSEEMNDQTFYMSNMTPQDYDFNSGIWLDLENRVRTGYTCNDTLYVVTGAHWSGKVSGRYPVPTHYYKVFLRSRKGNTGKTVYQLSTEDLKCGGFWISHDERGRLSKKHFKTVAEIEQLTGFNFFPKVNVDKEQYVPSDWGVN